MATSNLPGVFARDIRHEPSNAIKITNRYVTIRTRDHIKHGDDYPIAIDRIDSPIKLAGWVHHLTEKLWFDNRVCREFIEKVSDHFGWNLHA